MIVIHWVRGKRLCGGYIAVKQVTNLNTLLDQLAEWVSIVIGQGDKLGGNAKVEVGSPRKHSLPWMYVLRRHGLNAHLFLGHRDSDWTTSTHITSHRI